MNENTVVEVLTNLNNSSPEIRGALLCATDGTPLASAIENGNTNEYTSSISASLLALAQESATLLDRGELEQVIVKGSEGYLMLMSATRRSILALVLDTKAKPGLVVLDAKRAIERLQTML